MIKSWMRLLLVSGIVLAAVHALQARHPRLYYSAEDVPYLRTKAQGAFFQGVLQQYEDALEHKLNYSAGGVLQDVSLCSSCGWRHQLAVVLYLAGTGNTTRWGEIAKHEVLDTITQLSPSTGSWFAGSERNLEQLIASYDVLAGGGFFSAEEAVMAEAAFALNAQYLYAGIGVANDMASRLMNPAADRLAALGLIALTFPNQPNATKWLEQAVFEFRWMLANGVMEDGAWHEPSTRYHGAVLRAFIPFAYALREAKVLDAFNEIDNFKKFVGWYRHIQTPPDTAMGGCALTPALSDGNWEMVWEATLGWAAGAYALTDPTYAAELWAAWERACAPVALEPSPPAMLVPFLFIGCVRPDDCGPFVEPYSGRTPRSPTRRSKLLSGYAVLKQPSLASDPYFIMSTSTQRQTEGHEHPDRGSFSLYAHGTPLVLDPGVGWCGYNWFGKIPSSRANGTDFDKGMQFGAWYRGSQSHSMVNFAKEGAGIKPENETWRPSGAYGHEWGMRGAAWVDNHVFSAAIDYVALNVTHAVQASQLSTVQGYHRHVFANRRDDSYLLWDAVNAPLADCAQAQFNLHVVTQLGWPGKSGCVVAPNATVHSGTRLECSGLNGIVLDATVLQPSLVQERGLLHLESDPLPVQFTGMTGSTGSAPGMPATGAALGGDWNAPQNLPPQHPHWLPRTPTFVRIVAAEPAEGSVLPSACNGFLTLLQPRNTSSGSPPLHVELLDNFARGIFTVQVSSAVKGNASASRTVYMLGDRSETPGLAQLRGVAAVVGWGGDAGTLQRLDHAMLVHGTVLAVPDANLRIVASTNVTLTLRSPGQERYIIRILEPVIGATKVTVALPWASPPKQVNVWRGAHVWHVANTSLDSGEAEPIVNFEALPGLDYLIERQCVRSMKAGYSDGKGGWLCDPSQPYNDEL